ncbi:hypothetical protein [Limnochorda pilosa]|uniref:SCP2 domain-containing protein n=1 Tax=Limnochorda pilosa TaxID=1555112 RepID=A0A0K2SM23_LIMPI|nr:hypothetical protein [Limnochorda pilosa]BAS28163.1 hypothetical protein LIP_2322 [Limnochorda pilosa]
MGAYRDAQHLIDILSTLAERAKRSDAARGLREAGLVVAFVYHNPDVTVLMDGRTPTPDGSYMTMSFDTLGPKPDVTFEQSADVGHQFWQGKLNVPAALARGQVKARGAIAKALKLLPLLPALYETYREVLRERGEEAMLG